jgi:hypothetical protein
LPAAHGSHAVAPASANLPATHDSHASALVLPVAELAVPARQSTH